MRKQTPQKRARLQRINQAQFTLFMMAHIIEEKRFVFHKRREEKPNVNWWDQVSIEDSVLNNKQSSPKIRALFWDLHLNTRMHTQGIITIQMWFTTLHKTIKHKFHTSDKEDNGS